MPNLFLIDFLQDYSQWHTTVHVEALCFALFFFYSSFVTEKGLKLSCPSCSKFLNSITVAKSHLQEEHGSLPGMENEGWKGVFLRWWILVPFYRKFPFLYDICYEVSFNNCFR